MNNPTAQKIADPIAKTISALLDAARHQDAEQRKARSTSIAMMR